jgi:hypothetical protein
METINILVIGKHPEIMQTILRLINNKPEWSGIGALTQTEAITAFTQQPCSVVLLGAGISPEETKALCVFFRSHKPDVPVVEHYGGGSGLLYAEIFGALGLIQK